MQCCEKKGGGDEDCKLVNMDVNDTGFKVLQNLLCKCLNRRQ